MGRIVKEVDRVGDVGIEYSRAHHAKGNYKLVGE